MGVVGEIGKSAAGFVTGVGALGVQAGEFVGHKLFDSPDVPAAQVTAPPLAPDLTDEAVQAARIAARKRVLIGHGLSASFLTGPLGDESKPSTKTPSLSGY